MPFVYRQKVLFQHCDPAGIVFYPRYMEMMNATVEEWFATRLKHSFSMMHGAMQAGVPTAELRVVFSAPSRLGEMLAVSLYLRRLGRSSAALEFVAECEGQVRLTMTSTLVFISFADGRPQPWPDRLRRRMEAELEPAPPADAQP